jgi:hypothetical protein
MNTVAAGALSRISVPLPDSSKIGEPLADTVLIAPAVGRFGAGAGAGDGALGVTMVGGEAGAGVDAGGVCAALPETN